MFNENNCLENLKHIVSEYADDENIKNLSLDELRSSYTKIADNIYPISVSNRLKYKNMLWNIDNLKPEIRSRFQTELFNTWHSVYIKSIKTDQIEDLSEIKKSEFGVKKVTDYEDRFYYFLIPAILLLVIELFISEKKSPWYSRINKKLGLE